MKPIVAAPLVLLATLFAMPVHAQQRAARGPLMRAVHDSRWLESARGNVGAAVQTEDRSKSWTRVIALAPGTKILVEVRGAAVASRIFVQADESELIVKVPELSDVLQRLPRQDIVAIKTPPRRRGSVIGASIGAAGGFVLGYASAVHLAYKQCNGSCSDEKALMGLSLVGFPIAGAWLGYQANSRTTQDVIYRAPVAILDSRDLTWWPRKQAGTTGRREGAPPDRHGLRSAAPPSEGAGR
jgi:hypothetical protein